MSETMNYKLLGITVIVALIAGGFSGVVFTNLMTGDRGSTPGFAEFTLEATIEGFKGIGGDINNVINPTLDVELNDQVTIILKAGDTLPHDFKIDEFGTSDVVSTLPSVGESEITFTFTADQAGSFIYYCSVAGHYATMHGTFNVGGAGDLPEDAINLGTNVIRAPDDIPDPVGAREARNVTITLITEEVTAELDDGTSFEFWTFNGTVPGPLVRVRVGDTLIVNLINPASSKHTHNVDFHAVNARGGGAEATTAAPGETATLVTKVEWEGVFVYHCAAPHVPTHISKGMYGAISVEPADGLPEVDYEFYVGQNEIYTKFPKGTQGHQEFDDKKQLQEIPDYVIFNGRAAALTLDDYKLKATNDSTVRMFFAVGGPNLASNFHLIGGVWDRVYYMTNWDEPNMYNAETIVVPPGSALALEFDITRIGLFILVDHALSRTFDKGAIGFLEVTL
jgi:nitrite reductase (NO-forming)